MIKFEDWMKEREKDYKECCTDTGDVAHYAQRVPMHDKKDNDKKLSKKSKK